MMSEIGVEAQPHNAPHGSGASQESIARPTIA
jgi:hypothetical protein